MTDTHPGIMVPDYPPASSPTDPGTPTRGMIAKEMSGAIVATCGLLILAILFALAVFTLPDDASKGQYIAGIATAAFGVIGAVIGAYFGVNAAGKARDQVVDIAKEYNQNNPRRTTG